ncbi:MAG: acetylxylan esterase [Chloroflexi bacterium]|nr:acetylxylan esterase [Chloroflexota bacterium]
MSQRRRHAQRLLVRTWPLLASLALLAAAPPLLSVNRHGRVAVRTSLFLPDMVLQVPYIRPVRLISSAPRREHVTIDYQSRNGPRSIEADIYSPAHGSNHPGVVFSMGAPPLDLDEPRLVRIAEDSARAGVVMIVPFSDRLDDVSILPEEIDALVAEFQYVRDLPGVDPERVGFFGASVGGSLALVAAADPRINEQVDLVVSFGGYFNALETFGAIRTHRIQYQGIDEKWTPREHAELVVAHQLIDRVDDADDRELLEKVFLDYEPATDAQVAALGRVGRSAYDFLANTDPAAVATLIQRLPTDAVEELDYLSPETSIGDVGAELIIIHDRADPYIPYTESRRLRDAPDRHAVLHFSELRLFEHVQPKLNQRPEIIALDSTRLLLRLYQLMLLWD